MPSRDEGMVVEGPIDSAQRIVPRQRSQRGQAIYVRRFPPLGLPRNQNSGASHHHAAFSLTPDTPVVARLFSHHLYQTFTARRTLDLFPVTGKPKSQYRHAIAKAVFHGGFVGVEEDPSRHARRIVLRHGDMRLPYMAWTAGRREFTPLLLGLYNLLPSTRRSRAEPVEWVIIEEPEMGLHPRAISVVVMLVLDLIWRGLFNAARLLAREKVFDKRNLPYRTQLVPLSAICAVLGDRFESDTVKKKLARWYWSGVFGELYGGTKETRFANDMTDVVRWIEGAPEPRTVRDVNLAPTRLLTLQTRQSAAYKGMTALLMQAGSADFINGDSIELTTYFDQAVDSHHIFPRRYCQKQGYPRQKWNSVINKAPITARTNRILRHKAPSRYLAHIESNHGVTPGRLDEIIATHRINPALLRADDFDGFIRDRASRLLDLIEEAIGKAVVGRDAEDVVAAYGGAL